MTEPSASRPPRGGGRYEIRVKGRLAPRWVSRFAGMVLIDGPEGTTVIAGAVTDQAALHGLLRTLGDLGLPLISVTEAHPENATIHPENATIHPENDTTTPGD